MKVCTLPMITLMLLLVLMLMTPISKANAGFADCKTTADCQDGHECMDKGGYKNCWQPDGRGSALPNKAHQAKTKSG